MVSWAFFVGGGHVEKIIDNLPKSVDTVIGDGGYDTKRSREAILKQEQKSSSLQEETADYLQFYSKEAMPYLKSKDCMEKGSSQKK